MELVPLVVYKVTKNSSDGTFTVGDIVWKCKNGDIMCANQGGWIDTDEYNNTPEMSDFEAVVDTEYFVLSTEKEERIVSFLEVETQMQRQKLMCKV